jgi:hypothetical protein
MPGLLRGVARTAVVAGTATAVSNRVSRRQGERWQRQYEADAYEQQQQYEPPPQQYQQPVYAAPAPAPAPAATDHVTALQQLAELKAQGILTDAEFATEKARILAS